jgi:DNA-3-methyladenine glycosylase
MALRLKKLPRSFYLQPTLKVARELLGLFLVRKIGRKSLIGRIVEVEAYLGSKDPASHAYRGRTKRNEVMFWKGGHLYVYFTYGIHYCCNIVTEEKGTGHAVLLRAVEPMEGIESMKRNRRLTKQENRTKLLCSGPARLCQAFAIGDQENGTDLCGDRIWIAREIRSTRPKRVSRSTRVGISNGKHHKWRYFLKDSPYISPGKPV